MKKDGVKDGYISRDLLLNIMCDGDKIRTGDIVRDAIRNRKSAFIEYCIMQSGKVRWIRAAISTTQLQVLKSRFKLLFFMISQGKSNKTCF